MEDHVKNHGFYTIDASLLYQSSRKPFHLEKRFAKSLKISSIDKQKQVEQRREAILEQIRNKSSQNFLRVKRVAKEIRDRREGQNVSDAPKKKPSAWSILLKAFKELELPSPSSQDTWLGFNDLSSLLKQPKVIVVSTKILNAALKIVDDSSRRRGRVLLTSYMILMCPKEVLQDIDSNDEKRLHDSAKNMLILFEVWLGAHGRPGATAARLAFVEAWNTYNSLFEAWKSSDCEQLVDNMIEYYNELSSLRQTVIEKNHGDESTGDQLKRQLNEVKAKIEKVGGPTALEKLRRNIDSSSNQQEPPEEEQQNEPQLKTRKVNQLLNGYTNPSAGLTNEYLAHELILDPDFQLEKYTPQNSLEKQVRSVAEKAYFDKIAEDVEKGTADASLLSLIKDIKTRLLAIVRPGTSMHTSIDEGIDLGLIEQQMKQKLFDMRKMIHYVLDTASSMCAPVRDPEIKQARDTQDMMDQLKQIFSIIENMSLDLANFRLRSVRPHLISISVEYERGKFADLLNSEQVQLARTEAWLNKSASKLCRLAAQRNPECIQPEKNNRPSHDSVYENAIVTLLGQPRILNDLPETLALDRARMSMFQNELQAITIVASLLMLSRNFGTANHSHILAGLAEKLFTMLEDSTTTIDNLAAEIIRSVDVSADKREMVTTMVDKTVSHSDTIYSLILRRVLSVIKSTIHHNKFVSNVVISSNGLEHVRDNLESLSIKIQRLTHHNKKVYSPWYDEIIKSALDKYVVV